MWVLFYEQDCPWKANSLEFHSLTTDRIFGYTDLSVSAQMPFLGTDSRAFINFLRGLWSKVKSQVYHLSCSLACKESQPPSASSSALTGVPVSVPSLIPFPLFSEEEIAPPLAQSIPLIVFSVPSSLLGSWELPSWLIYSSVGLSLSLFSSLASHLTLGSWLLPFSL